MLKYFTNYYWNKGKPIGIQEADPEMTAITYKIVPDPYHRRYSIEKYSFESFEKVVYDSFLLDFRYLEPLHQQAWEKEKIKESENTMTCLLKNQDDRFVLIETYYFEKNLCRRCEIQSIHQVPLAYNQMYYKELNDSFNGVILFDNENKPVMKKEYEIDLQTKEFTNLLKEDWNLKE